MMMLPSMEMFKTVNFTRCICLFNETFAKFGSKKRECEVMHNMACLWHEGIMGRHGEDIASTSRQFVNENRGCSSLTLWLDNCADQNKNWTILPVLPTAVNNVDALNIE
ncbi:hypothetical protein RRG08_045867 [Elysia crispata]|uniref:Uncharacterized protein n=1 Tax=Elysia crispata TaxID=231223 RepID=A0AAE0ZEW7_9GAST|nr:hypothetical protein RRG08_045867 [Elysia crispata]